MGSTAISITRCILPGNPIGRLLEWRSHKFQQDKTCDSRLGLRGKPGRWRGAERAPQGRRHRHPRFGVRGLKTHFEASNGSWSKASRKAIVVGAMSATAARSWNHCGRNISKYRPSTSMKVSGNNRSGKTLGDKAENDEKISESEGLDKAWRDRWELPWRSGITGSRKRFLVDKTRAAGFSDVGIRGIHIRLSLDCRGCIIYPMVARKTKTIPGPLSVHLRSLIYIHIYISNNLLCHVNTRDYVSSYGMHASEKREREREWDRGKGMLESFVTLYSGAVCDNIVVRTARRGPSCPSVDRQGVLDPVGNNGMRHSSRGKPFSVFMYTHSFDAPNYPRSDTLYALIVITDDALRITIE